MKKRDVLRMIMLPALLQMSASAAVYTVAKDGTGNFTSIQAAINVAKENDEIIIKDKSIYEEQVTIDSTKNGLVLQSADPSSTEKPVITYCDRTNIHPASMAETKDSKTITYNMNGALRILGAKRVKVLGIAVDGAEHAPFAYPAVWGGIEPLFHGNAAIVLCKAGDVVIRYCEARNAYYGIYCHDRNQGGVFAYAEEPMIFPEEVVPFSGFAQAGNHLIELSRIHDNTWGIYFESLWDLGSTVRYNLIYENHHVNNEQAVAVAKMPGGAGQAGGAIVFKDADYANVVIHNNTFYHNYLLFAALGGSGAQHLLFNNIYAEPWRLWKTDPVFPNPAEALDPYFVNRMFNCIYSCQAEMPETTTVAIHDSIRDEDAGTWVKIDTMVKAISRVRIMNGMEQVKPGMTISMAVQLSTRTAVFTKTIPDVIEPGNLITASNTIKPFPEASNVRWVEIPFLSTDPSSVYFLVPDWSEKRVQNYVVNQGWEKHSGLNQDGSHPEIGAILDNDAILEHGEQIVSGMSVRPTIPMVVNGTNATLSFALKMDDTTLTKLKLRYIGTIGLNQENGDGTSVIPAANVDYSLSTIEEFTVREGGNTTDFTFTSGMSPANFTKMVIQFCVTGVNASGHTVVSSVAQIPYYKIDYYLKVELLDAGSAPVTVVTAGAPYKLRVTPFKSGGEKMDILVNPVTLFPGSGYDLYSPDETQLRSITSGINGDSLIPVVFHTVPVGDIDQVLASGKYGDIPFLGASDDIRVLPGAIDQPVCLAPPPQPVPGFAYPLTVSGVDKYNNQIHTGQEGDLVARSSRPDIVYVVNENVEYDVSGLATFLLLVKDGVPGDTFTISVTSSLTGKTSSVPGVVVDGSPVKSAQPLHAMAAVYTCELFSLQGRLLKTFSAGEEVRTAASEVLRSRQISRGTYLMRLTDIATRKRILTQRLMLLK